MRHQLHAVADAERRHAQREHGGIDLGRALGVHGRGSAGEDQRDGVAAAQLVGGRPVRDELRVDARLAHAARDQLRVLPAEVEHEHGPLLRERVQLVNFSGHHREHLPVWPAITEQAKDAGRPRTQRYVAD